MNPNSSPRSRMVSVLLYALALLLILVAPILGLMAAVIGTWHALLAGSFWYMPLGLVLVLAAIALVHNHRPFSLVLIGLVLAAGIAWFRADPLQQLRLLDAIQALTVQTGLMMTLLLMSAVVLILLYAARLAGRQAWRGFSARPAIPAADLSGAVPGPSTAARVHGSEP